MVGTSVPAIRGFFGGTSPKTARLQFFQTSLTAKQVKGILGHDPRSRTWRKMPDPELREMYEYLQRATETDRTQGLQEYINQRLRPNPNIPGAFPAISIGLLDAVGWSGDGGREESAVGTLMIPVESKRILLDGLGRLTAMLNLLDEEDQAKPPVAKDQSRNNWFSFPVTIYAPAPGHPVSIEDLGQLFFDFNYRQKQVKKSKAMTVDKSDLHIRMANAIGEDSSGVVIRHGGMYKKSATLGGNSKELVSQQHLLKFVRGACEGRKAQDSDKARIDEPNLHDQSFPELRQKLEDFLVGVEARMGPRFEDHELLHLSSIGWQVLGLVFHDLEYRFAEELSEADKAVVMDRLAAIDWSKYNAELIRILGEGNLDPTTGRNKLARFTKLGRETKDGFLKYVRHECGLDQYDTEPTQATAEVTA